MRTLYAEFYKQKKRGFTEDEFRQVCEKFPELLWQMCLTMSQLQKKWIIRNILIMQGWI